MQLVQICATESFMRERSSSYSSDDEESNGEQDSYEGNGRAIGAAAAALRGENGSVQQPRRVRLRRQRQQEQVSDLQAWQQQQGFQGDDASQTSNGYAEGDSSMDPVRESARFSTVQCFAFAHTRRRAGCLSSCSPLLRSRCPNRAGLGFRHHQTWHG